MCFQITHGLWMPQSHHNFPCTSASYRWAGIKTPPPPRPGMQAQHGCWPLLWPPERSSLAQWSDAVVFLMIFGCLSFSGLLVSHLLTPHTTVAQPQEGFQLQAAAFIVTVPQPSFWSPVRQDHYWTFPWLKTRTLSSSSFRAGVLSLKYRFSREQRPCHLTPSSIAVRKGKIAPIYWMHMPSRVLGFVLLAAEGPTCTGSNLNYNSHNNMWCFSQVVSYTHLIWANQVYSLKIKIYKMKFLIHNSFMLYIFTYFFYSLCCTFMNRHYDQ